MGKIQRACVLVLASCHSAAPELRAPELEEGARIFPLQYASAADVARTLNELMESSMRACAHRRGCVLYLPGHWPAPPEVIAARSRFSEDLRTSSLLVACPPEDLPLVLELVARLDRPSSNGERADPFVSR